MTLNIHYQSEVKGIYLGNSPQNVYLLTLKLFQTCMSFVLG